MSESRQRRDLSIVTLGPYYLGVKIHYNVCIRLHTVGKGSNSNFEMHFSIGFIIFLKVPNVEMSHGNL